MNDVYTEDDDVEGFVQGELKLLYDIKHYYVILDEYHMNDVLLLVIEN